MIDKALIFKGTDFTDEFKDFLRSCSDEEKRQFINLGSKLDLPQSEDNIVVYFSGTFEVPDALVEPINNVLKNTHKVYFGGSQNTSRPFKKKLAVKGVEINQDAIAQLKLNEIIVIYNKKVHYRTQAFLDSLNTEIRYFNSEDYSRL